MLKHATLHIFVEKSLHKALWQLSIPVDRYAQFTILNPIFDSVIRNCYNYTLVIFSDMYAD